MNNLIGPTVHIWFLSHVDWWRLWHLSTNGPPAMELKTQLLQGLLDKVSGLSAIKGAIHYAHSKSPTSDKLSQKKWVREQSVPWNIKHKNDWQCEYVNYSLTHKRNIVQWSIRVMEAGWRQILTLGRMLKKRSYLQHHKIFFFHERSSKKGPMGWHMLM